MKLLYLLFTFFACVMPFFAFASPDLQLTEKNHVVVRGQVTGESVSKWILELNNIKDKDVIVYINSPGGIVTSGLGIYDTMQYIQPRVTTICIGQACSMGSLLLAAGEPGQRFSLPNSRIMIHQPSGGAQGQATDIEIHAKEVLSLKKRLNELYSTHTGQAVEAIETACEASTQKVILKKQNGDVSYTHADINAAKRDFGFAPRVELKDGIKNFVNWYKNY